MSEEGIFLRKGEILRHLEEEDITIEEITTETMLQKEDMESEKLNCGDSLKKAFIASPADVDTCRKVKLQDVEVLSHYNNNSVGKVTTETMLQSENMEPEKLHCDISLKTTFIASPADIDTCRKVKLQDVEVLNNYKNTIERITTEAMSQNEDMESEKLNCSGSLGKTFIASPADIVTCRKVKLQDVDVLNHYNNTVGNITTETMLQNENMESKKPNCDIFSEKTFITSTADVDTHRKVKLQDTEVLDHYKKEFEQICKEYNDIFSKDSSDIGKIPLITMEIETGDSPPVCQRPYNLPLKHVDWVQKELDTLEKAGVITRSVSLWASPIVIVPKRTELGEPPKKRLCVDYRVINSLLLKVNKAHSKAKGVLTLVPLPKIDEIYAWLKGSNIYKLG